MSGENLAQKPESDIAAELVGAKRHESSGDVGGILRSARIARGVSIEEVAFALKLSARQVADIEANEWSGLPKAVVRGFVRNYVRYLGLDSREVMAGLDLMALPEGPELRVDVGAPVVLPKEGRASRKDFFWIVAGMLVLFMAVVAYLLVPSETWQATIKRLKSVGMMGGVSSAPETVDGSQIPTAGERPPVVNLMPTVPAEKPSPLNETPFASSSDRNKPEAGKNLDQSETTLGVLIFSFTKPSWVEVRDRHGKVIFSQLNSPGSRHEISGQPPFSLVIGNVSGVSLEFRGKAVDLMSRRSKGDVARLTLE